MRASTGRDRSSSVPTSRATMSRSVRTPRRRPSGSATTTLSPVPVPWIAMRHAARLVPGSACAFGSGALFAKPVYATGVGWVTLSTWRFALGAALAWAWLLLVPGRRAALATIDRRGIAIAVGLGVLYTGNSGTYYAG